MLQISFHTSVLKMEMD